MQKQGGKRASLPLKKITLPKDHSSFMSSSSQEN